MNALRRHALNAWNHLEQAFDSVFGGKCSPLRHLGALAVLLFCILTITGVYLYVVLDTSVAGAYPSIHVLATEQPWFGGALRSLHRYAADAFVLVIVAHLAREWLVGRYTGFRRYSWLTGVPLLLLAQMSGVGGFWLSWDRLGQFSAIATAEWLDWLPLFGAQFTRNFLNTDAVSDRFFSLLVFVHIGVSLSLLFGLWFHVQRLARPQLFPPRAPAIGSCVMLLLLALLQPIAGQGPADLALVPAVVSIDWVLLFLHPLMYATSPAFVWALLLAAVLLVVLLPYTSGSERAAVARVNPDNCNGCGFCFEDCPYAAITMQPHADGKPGRRMAQVQSDLCASCGICTGACPSSTPFRSVDVLTPGIDMPQAPIGTVRDQLRSALTALRGTRRIVVFGCDQGVRVSAVAGPDIAAISLICTGMLPPSFIEYALRLGATDVVVTGCRDGACAFRLGQRWTEQRVHGAREPHLRAGVPRDRVRITWKGRGEEAALRDELRAMTDPACMRSPTRRAAQ